MMDEIVVRQPVYVFLPLSDWLLKVATMIPELWQKRSVKGHLL